RGLLVVGLVHGADVRDPPRAGLPRRAPVAHRAARRRRHHRRDRRAAALSACRSTSLRQTSFSVVADPRVQPRTLRSAPPSGLVWLVTWTGTRNGSESAPFERRLCRRNRSCGEALEWVRSLPQREIAQTTPAR